MMDLIRSMFASPEAQTDPYVWAAALMGHWAIGVGLLSLALSVCPRRPWTCAALISAGYGAVWEGGQAISADKLTLALLADGVVDWTAVTLGVVAAAGIWLHARRLMAAAAMAVLAILAAGTRRRR